MQTYLPDANVLINCLRTEAAGHRKCRQWLEKAAQNGDAIALCELVEVAFLRICTLPALRIAPMTEALGFWNDLKAYRETVRLTAGHQHAVIFETLIKQHAVIGNDVNDAWLAALAMESDAVLVSADEGFAKFAGLKWLNPSAG